jgi:hypothetical protein
MAEKGRTAWGEGRSALSFRTDESAIGVTTESSNRRVRERDLWTFEVLGPVDIAAEMAERPSSGANVTRMMRPNRKKVLLLLILPRGASFSLQRRLQPAI